ncbi:uncharacterized protein LAESUDRAFT_653187, partial [Laetiporus sulphureus 93-53]
KIKWFNSRMTAQFREDTLQDFVKGEIYELYSTDSFGMVRSMVSWYKYQNQS